MFPLDSIKPTKIDLPKVFQKYAGVELPHEDYEHKMRSGRSYTMQRLTTEGESLLKEIYQVAADNNINLRVCTPDSMGTMDHKMDRLNIHTDENWVIESKCNYG